MRIGVGLTKVFSFFLRGSKRIPKGAAKKVAKTIAEPTFGGLTQSVISQLAEETPRGIGAVIDGDTVSFIYKSASGKIKKAVPIVFDATGRLVAHLGNGSNFQAGAPRIFLEKLASAMKVNK